MERNFEWPEEWLSLRISLFSCYYDNDRDRTARKTVRFTIIAAHHVSQFIRPLSSTFRCPKGRSSHGVQFYSILSNSKVDCNLDTDIFWHWNVKLAMCCFLSFAGYFI